MGKRGPKPEPSSIKVFKGNPGHRKARTSRVQPESSAVVPDPPAWLGEDGTAIWNRIAPKLHAAGLLTVLDVEAFSLYCSAWDDFFSAKKLIAKHGAIAISSTGAAYQHPAVGIKNRAAQQIKQFGALFGLSSSDRAGLDVHLPMPDDDHLVTFADLP